jgi:hypothetical protein
MAIIAITAITAIILIIVIMLLYGRGLTAPEQAARAHRLLPLPAALPAANCLLRGGKCPMPGHKRMVITNGVRELMFLSPKDRTWFYNKPGGFSSQ